MRFSELDQPSVGDILEVELGDEIVEAVITAINGDEIVAETDNIQGATLLAESYGRYYCSTDKKWKERQGPKQTREGVMEMDKSQTPPGRDGSNDEGGKKEYTAKIITPKKAVKDGEKILNKELNKKQGMAEAGPAQGEYSRVLTALRLYYPRFEMEELNTPEWHRVIANKANVTPEYAGQVIDDFVKASQPQPDEEENLDWMDGHGIKEGKESPEKELERLKLRQDAEHGGASLKRQAETQARIRELEKQIKDNNEKVNEAEYQGRKVALGKPMQGDVKKFKVYVKDPGTGNVKKVNFGDPNMRIKKSNPARRKSFRARHNCSNPGPRTKARYWSCRKW
jgi:hypothetical protein